MVLGWYIVLHSEQDSYAFVLIGTQKAPSPPQSSPVPRPSVGGGKEAKPNHHYRFIHHRLSWLDQNSYEQ